MSGYVKLFDSILYSTVWRESDPIRILWVTLLLMANRQGVVEASVPGLADAARVSLRDCKRALKKLSKPDRYSRTPDNEGRRIKEIPGGFLLLNYRTYREKMSVEDRREYQRQWVANKRAEKSQSGNVDTHRQKSTVSIQATASAKADTILKNVGQTDLPLNAAEAAPTSKRPQTDSEWLAALRNDTTYAGINVDLEYGKMVRWCEANHKQPTRRRFINWLNRTERPLNNARITSNNQSSRNAGTSNESRLEQYDLSRTKST